MTCGMCSTICWQCADRLQLLKNMLEQIEGREATLEYAYMEASDAERQTIADQLTDCTEAVWDLREQIDDLEGNNH